MKIRLSTTVAFPLVIVPVLSKTIVRILCAASSGSPPLIKMPFVAPTPVPTMTAVGVAKPNAHGHAIDSTDIEQRNANSRIISILVASYELSPPPP